MGTFEAGSKESERNSEAKYGVFRRFVELLWGNRCCEAALLESSMAGGKIKI